MQEQDFTSMREARLKADIERARERLMTRTTHARTKMANAPAPDTSGATASPNMTRWGGGAFYFCIWFAMIAPIALILANWD